MNPITSLRHTLHLTLRQAASHFNISYSLYRQIEAGMRNLPDPLLDTVENPKELAQAYESYRERCREYEVEDLNDHPIKPDFSRYPLHPPMFNLITHYGYGTYYAFAKSFKIRERAVKVETPLLSAEVSEALRNYRWIEELEAAQAEFFNLEG